MVLVTDQDDVWGRETCVLIGECDFGCWLIGVSCVTWTAGGTVCGGGGMRDAMGDTRARSQIIAFMFFLFGLLPGILTNDLVHLPILYGTTMGEGT